MGRLAATVSALPALRPGVDARCVLLLIAQSPEERALAALGLAVVMSRHHQHPGTARRPVELATATAARGEEEGEEEDGAVAGLAAGGGGRARRARRLLRALRSFHHLYRPHHDVNVAPGRYPDGALAEVAYDQSHVLAIVKRRRTFSTVRAHAHAHAHVP